MNAAILANRSVTSFGGNPPRWVGTYGEAIQRSCPAWDAANVPRQEIAFFKSDETIEQCLDGCFYVCRERERESM